MRLDAVIVFEPTELMIDNVCRQLASLGDRSVVLDNSVSVEAQQLVSRVCGASGVTVLRPGGNVGTGRGINLLLREAQEQGLDWLHYLDQDSVMTADYARQVVELPPGAEKFAMIGARHQAPDQGTLAEAAGLVPTRFVISSGTLFNVSQVVRADGADERLFLDLVDHELCLRVRSLGMRVALDAGRVLLHPIGEGSHDLGSRLTLWRHPEWRRELMWRNSWLLAREYCRSKPLECVRHLCVRLAETLAAAVVFRDVGYLRSALRGTRAALSNRRRRSGYAGQVRPPGSSR